jgi:hypothetical protein
MEALTSIARAGADMTITYYAKDVARWLGEAVSAQHSAISALHDGHAPAGYERVTADG